MTRRTIDLHVKRLLALHSLYMVEDKLMQQRKPNRRNLFVGLMNREREWLTRLATRE